MIVGLTWAVLMFLFATYAIRSEDEMKELEKNKKNKPLRPIGRYLR